MSFKFEKLEVWELALDYLDLMYEIVDFLPKSEQYNLKSQLSRAATSIALNIAEGSTGQTNTEQARILGLAIRSLLETVACQLIIRRRKLLDDVSLLSQGYREAEKLAAKLHRLRQSIAPEQQWLREESEAYLFNFDSTDIDDDSTAPSPSSAVRPPSDLTDSSDDSTAPSPSSVVRPSSGLEENPTMDRIERIELETMRLEKDGKLAWVTFNRPRYLNAMNNQATLDINRIADDLYDDPCLRMVVIRGEGRAFSTGIDLKQLGADEIGMIYHHRWERALRRFETMEKLVVVAMHGYCLGGALQLALACDIRVSTPDCQLGLPAVKESLIPGLSTWRLPKYVGWGRAKKMIVGGQNIGGEEALRVGLVDHLVPAENFWGNVDELAQEYMRGNSLGTRMSKLLVNEAFDRPYDSVLHYYFTLQERAQFSPDGEEGRRAYVEGRDPVWE